MPFLRESMRLVTRNKGTMYFLIVLYSFLAVKPVAINRSVLSLSLLVYFAERYIFQNTANINASHNLLYSYQGNSAWEFKHSHTKPALIRKTLVLDQASLRTRYKNSSLRQAVVDESIFSITLKIVIMKNNSFIT